jgi:hypothetical protein
LRIWRYGLWLVYVNRHRQIDAAADRQQAADRLADLKVQDAHVEAQRVRVTAEAGPALYLAKLFGSDDTKAVVRLITALLVLVLDPLAVLLTLAAARSPHAWIVTLAVRASSMRLKTSSAPTSC